MQKYHSPKIVESCTYKYVYLEHLNLKTHTSPATYVTADATYVTAYVISTLLEEWASKDEIVNVGNYQILRES